LLWVRIKNVVFSDDGSRVEIELYPAPGLRFKTPGSTRRETLTDPTVIVKLRQWLACRKFDEAAEDDYVFGREELPGLYRRSLIIGTLRVVLKAVTGDASMTIYALRHTVASRQFTESQTLGIQNRNRHFQSAEDLGHIAPPMGFDNCKHTYEQALAQELAALNKDEIKFVDSDALKLTNSSREAVRTMASRKKAELSISDVIWQSLEREAGYIAFSPLADVDKWTVPEAPKLTITGHINGSPLQVLTVIQKLQSFSIQEVALLSDIPIASVKAISECIFKLAHQRRKLLPPEKRALAPVLITVQDALNELNIDINSAD
jgi:hypothetical protein